MMRRVLVPLMAMALAATAASPVVAIDRDGDGLRDFFEKKWGATRPTSADSDGDGVVDSAEDTDGDRLSDLGEQRYGSDPNDRDSDGDGKPDGVEDNDRNGRTNALEQDKRPLPRGLRPTLTKAKTDYPPIRSDCFAKLGESTARKCILGDAQGGTTIVLFGDSHALMWSPSFSRAAKQAGWRLTAFFKGGCPSVDVETKAQYRHDRNRSCDRWRNNVFAWIDAHPPDAVVLTNSDGYTTTVDGRRVAWAARTDEWKQGLQRTVARLPAVSDVVIFADGPWNRTDPVACLKSHRKNIAACATRRQAPDKRRFAVAERDVARAAGASFRSLHDYVCSYDPCPLVQGKTLIWRDRGHLTKTFARKLAPTVRRVMSDIVGDR